MLKFTYTENGVNLELLTESLDEWIINRVLLAVRAGMPIFLQPSSASFLLPYDSEVLNKLDKMTSQYERENLEIYTSNDDSVEISLKGTWVVSDLEQQEGVLVTMLDSEVELLIFQLWFEANVELSAFAN